MTTAEQDEVTIHVRYKDVEETFSGCVDDAWVAINKFFSEFIPTFELSKKMLLTVDLQKLLKECEDIIAFANEGPHLMVPKDRLTDNETLALNLLASHLANRLGVMKEAAMSRDELQAKLGKSSKITSTRLGELIKREMAARTSEGKFTITTFGIVQMQKDVLPKTRAKIGI